MSTETDIGNLYETILQRAADPDGLAYWSGLYAGGMSLNQIETGIIQSAEAQQYVVPIVELYQSAFGRQADAAGLSYWVHQYESGASLQDIAAGFAGSQEGQAAFNGSLVSEHFVEEVYANALGRAAASWEVGYWMSQGLTEGQVLAAISTSAEALGRYGDQANQFLADSANGTPQPGALVAQAPTLYVDPSDAHYTGATSGNTTFLALPVNGENSLNGSETMVGSGSGNVLEIHATLNGLDASPIMSGVQTIKFVGPQNVGPDYPNVVDLGHTTGVNAVEVLNGGGSSFQLTNAIGTGIDIAQASIINSPAGTNGNTELTLSGETAAALTVDVDHSGNANGNFTFLHVTGLSSTEGVQDVTLDLTPSASATEANPAKLSLDVSDGPNLHSLVINAEGHVSVDVAPMTGMYYTVGNDALAVANIVVNDLSSANPGGSADLTDNGLNYFTGLQSFDSTGYTGDVHLAVGGDSALVSIVTGSGNDVVDLSAQSGLSGTAYSYDSAFTVNLGDGNDYLWLGPSLLSHGDFDGGAGNNVVGITDGAALVSTETFHNFQALEIGPVADPTMDNTAGLAGGVGDYDLSLLPDLTSVHITASDLGGYTLAGDVTLDNAPSDFSLDLVASNVAIATGEESEISATAWSDNSHIITVNMAADTGDHAMTINLDAAAIGNLDSEGNTQTAVGGIIAGQIDVHGATDITLNSVWVDGGGSVPAAPEGTIGVTGAFNELALAVNDATSLTIHATLGTAIDQADQVAPNLTSIHVDGTGADVDLAYNATAGAETGTPAPDVLHGIEAPLTLVDASQLVSVTIPPSSPGESSSVVGGNFHAIFTETAADTTLTFTGAEQANYVVFHTGLDPADNTTPLVGIHFDVTGGAADDYFSVDNLGESATFHIAAAADALVNDGAAPETDSGSGGGNGGGGGEVSATLLSSLSDPANALAGSTAVPDPAALAEGGSVESIFGFNANDTLQFSATAFAGFTVVDKAVDFSTTDVGAAITGFFSNLGAQGNDIVLAHDSGSDVNDVFVIVDANGGANFDPTIDPVIHLHNDAGLSAATVAAHILIA